MKIPPDIDIGPASPTSRPCGPLSCISLPSPPGPSPAPAPDDGAAPPARPLPATRRPTPPPPQEEVEVVHSEDEDEPVETAEKTVAQLEKERLRQMRDHRKKMMEQMQREANQGAAKGQAKRSQDRMRFLLRQAEIFQHFMPEGVKATPKKGGRGKSHRQEHAEEEEDAELLKHEDNEMGR